ncbi:Arginase/deacetylase [Auriscalpium vulgare]|uniref:Arginase/deacetylase n=1 Tax=Auriscalpium vulgare TaxID=40419 RepID=A0ACB8S4D3_9AGAM|nr:Arginase/deacetylase [Auriscalpium vulgare]
MASAAAAPSLLSPDIRASGLPGAPSNSKATETLVFLQDACLQHRYIRTRDASHIVERPERLRSVKIGLAAAIARFQDIYHTDTILQPSTSAKAEITDGTDADALADAIGRMNIAASPEEIALPNGLPIRILRSSAKVDLVNNAAVKYVHGDIDGDVYLEKLCGWARDSVDKITSGQSEIPPELSQGDLYLSPASIDAIQGALGTVCEAVDAIVAASRTAGSSGSRAFVAVRPPGHHCGEDTPSGFCFVNNVAVAAAHAYLKHGVKRIVIFDIDLHHGNGTQSIAWQINEETYRTTLESDAGAPPSKPGLQVYYGSVHDVLSYPCEDGKQALVQAASVSIHGPHGQYIENVHLKPYESETQFWDELYSGAYSRLLRRAAQFVQETGNGDDDVMVFIRLACGFDASEHEHSSMSRHGRKVPTSFFHRFTQDACAFADTYARGRIVSVLEGGYSDKALLSGTLAHLTGLVEPANSKVADRQSWWSSENVQMLEKLAKKRGRGPRTSHSLADPAWFDRASALLAILDPLNNSTSSKNTFVPPSSMTLRTRKRPEGTPMPHQAPSPGKKSVPAPHDDLEPSLGSLSANSSDLSEPDTSLPAPVAKKLPRVILKLGPRPET